MNYEKQLKEALSNVNTPYAVASWIEENFPEIKESEDEMIRKSISNYINATLDDNEGVEKEKWLGWLEKQGDKKSSDEVLKIRQEVYQSGYNDGYKHGCADTIGEKKSINCADDGDMVNSKFKVGDWVVQKYLGKYLGTYKIVAVYESWYEVISYNDGIQYSIGFDKENDCHLWSTKDAKDGDVLQLGKVTAIFKEFIGNENCKCYCSVYEGEFEVPTQDNNYGCYNATPATKAQRDLLFQKMKEAGYEWKAGCLQ